MYGLIENRVGHNRTLKVVHILIFGGIKYSVVTIQATQPGASKHDPGGSTSIQLVAVVN